MPDNAAMSNLTCLSGKVLLDLGQLHPGPHTAMLLGQLGATVIKVERPGTGDSARTLGHDTFAKYNRGKLSIALDLKQGGDRAILLRLVRRAHGLIEGFRPGVMSRLGLDYETLQRVNPALVMCSITGFGQTGPYAQRPGHDLNYLALAGYWAVPSQIDDVVGRPRVRLSDYCGSMYAALSMVVAIMTAEQSGHGQHLDVSLHGSTLAWTLPGIDMMLRRTGDDLDAMAHIMPDNDLFKTADGRYIALGILEEKFWNALRDRLSAEFPVLASGAYSTRSLRMANKRALHDALNIIFASKSRREWKACFEGTDIPWAPVLEHDEIAQDPHVLAQGLHTPCGTTTGFRPFFPVRFSGGLPDIADTVPGLDADRQAILDWLA